MHMNDKKFKIQVGRGGLSQYIIWMIVHSVHHILEVENLAKQLWLDSVHHSLVSLASWIDSIRPWLDSISLARLSISLG